MRIGVQAGLVGLVLVAIVPAILYAGWLIWRDAQAQRAVAERQLLQAAMLVRQSIDAELGAAITFLEAFRHIELLRVGDIAGFAEVARRVKAERPHWISIVLVRPDGQQLVNLAAAPGQPLPNIAHYEVVQRALRTRQPAISELMFGIVGRVHLVAVDVPVFGEDGEVRYVLGLSMYASRLGDIIAENVPPGATGALVDSRNIIAARSADAPSAVGQPARNIDPAGPPTGIRYAAMREGEQALIVHARSELSGWTVVLAQPVAGLNAQLTWSFLWLGAGGLFLLALGIGICLLIASRTRRSLVLLTRDAESVVGGEAVPARPSFIREIDNLQRALIRAGVAQAAARRQAEQASEGLKQAQRMEAMGQLTGGVAHDFNNLLMVIEGSLRRLRRSCSPDAERSLAAIQTACERGATLTRQLLSFARRQPLQPEALDLAAWLPKRHEFLRHVLRGDIILDIAAAEGLPPIRVDRSELELALLNLASNARDAMPDGGSLRITAERLSREAASGLGASDGVRLSVMDSGVGIPQEHVAKVFEPFFTTKVDGKGTGLGLSQVYGFARQAGGTAHLESRPGQGTIVMLDLPAAERPLAEAAEAPRAARPRSVAPSRILLVDDNAEVRRAVADMLGEARMHVEEVGSAAEALDALARGPKPDLVITDIVMPGGAGGLELAHAIRAQAPEIPIVLMTGYADIRFSDEPFPFIRKPFGPEELARVLEHIRAAAR